MTNDTIRHKRLKYLSFKKFEKWKTIYKIQETLLRQKSRDQSQNKIQFFLENSQQRPRTVPNVSTHRHVQPKHISIAYHKGDQCCKQMNPAKIETRSKSTTNLINHIAKGTVWPIKCLPTKTLNSSKNKRKRDRQWHMQIHSSHQTITNIMRIQPKHQKPAKTKK